MDYFVSILKLIERFQLINNSVIQKQVYSNLFLYEILNILRISISISYI